MKTQRLLLLLLSVLLFLSGCAASHQTGEQAYPVDAYRTTMQYYDDFKILQIADLHLGVQTDLAHQLRIVSETIRREQPDLIVLTGDNFTYASKPVVKHLMATLNEECARLTELRGNRLTKFTVTFGNHDNQGDYPRYFINDEILQYVTEDGNEIADQKFAAFVDYENDDLFGLANFYIDLVDDRSKDADTADVKYRLHVIDSNTYHFMGTDYDYDVIHPEQLQHAANVYEQATADRDYIGLLFFHIPLFEYEQAYNQFVTSDTPELVGQGEYREPVMYGYENNGAYGQLRSANIVAYFCGHDHINYGDIIFNAHSEVTADRAIFSYGVKSTNQLYHDADMIGYKTVVLRDVTVDEFLSMEYVSANFQNYTKGYGNDENN